MLQTPRTILVVDDEDGARVLLKEFLGLHGYAVQVAPDAGVALEILRGQQVDLLLTDVDMPGMKGTELLAQVRQAWPALPVILITGKPSIETAVGSLRGGAFDYITKPFDLNHLRQVVNNALSSDDGGLDRTLVMAPTERVINGFVFRSVISEGAMGVVHLVERDGQRYALKLISANQDNEEQSREMLERFVREAEMASLIRHPNIVQIIDFGISETELVPYIVMEYVDGLPLSVMSRKLSPDDYGRRVELIRQIADALSAIHDQHILHRDIKPSNVLVTSGMVAKLTDFGIARPRESELTHQDQILGSPLYMAPESYLSAQVDHRADLFSLGVVAYEFLVGKLPFDGECITQIAARITREKPVQPRKIIRDFPIRLQQILARLLKKDPRERYQTAHELTRDLADFLATPGSWQSRLHALTQTSLFANDWN